MKKRKRSNKVYRSNYEVKVANTIQVDFEYETLKVQYIKPAKPSTYKPDFILKNGIIVEAKGLFTASDRKKHLLVKEQNPDLDIRFLFQNPNQTLSKKSRTTYADWCNKNGFTWAKGPQVPLEWQNQRIKRES